MLCSRLPDRRPKPSRVIPLPCHPHRRHQPFPRPLWLDDPLHPPPRRRILDVLPAGVAGAHGHEDLFLRVAVGLFAAAVGAARCVQAGLGLDAVYRHARSGAGQRGAGRTKLDWAAAAPENPWACGAVLVVGRFTMLKRSTA